MEQSAVYNRADGNDEEFRRRLEVLWDVGFVADITLNDDAVMSGVLIAISSNALILEQWDVNTQAPAGDPFTLEVAVVARVTVP